MKLEFIPRNNIIQLIISILRASGILSFKYFLYKKLNKLLFSRAIDQSGIFVLPRVWLCKSGRSQ